MEGQSSSTSATASRAASNDAEAGSPPGSLSSDKDVNIAKTHEPFKVEYARSNRSTCAACRKGIPQGDLRIATEVKARTFQGEIERWNHLDCFFGAHSVEDPAEMEGFAELEETDREMLRKRSKTSLRHPKLKVEHAKSGRSTCRGCNENIEPNDVRLAYMEETDRSPYPVPAWYHIPCFFNVMTADSIESFEGHEELTGEQKTELRKYLRSRSDTPPDVSKVEEGTTPDKKHKAIVEEEKKKQKRPRRAAAPRARKQRAPRKKTAAAPKKAHQHHHHDEGEADYKPTKYDEEWEEEEEEEAEREEEEEEVPEEEEEEEEEEQEEEEEEEEEEQEKEMKQKKRSRRPQAQQQQQQRKRGKTGGKGAGGSSGRGTRKTPTRQRRSSSGKKKNTAAGAAAKSASSPVLAK